MSLFGKKDPCPEPIYLPAQAPKFPRFCHRCGSALVPKVSPRGFHELTGEPQFNYWLSCPNWEGDQYKVVSREPWHMARAACLNATYTARIDWQASDYMDCTPEAPMPKAKTIRPSKDTRP
jgi:hypothetical protein